MKKFAVSLIAVILMLSIMSCGANSPLCKDGSIFKEMLQGIINVANDAKTGAQAIIDGIYAMYPPPYYIPVEVQAILNKARAVISMADTVISSASRVLKLACPTAQNILDVEKDLATVIQYYKDMDTIMMEVTTKGMK